MSATMTMGRVECPRCSGAGEIAAFRHVASGRCFLCWGAKEINLRDGFRRSRGMVETFVGYQIVYGTRDADTYTVTGTERHESMSIVVNPVGGGTTIASWWLPITDENRAEMRDLYGAMLRAGARGLKPHREPAIGGAR